MIKFPVRYNRDDEAIEDAEFNVIAHPFILPGMSVDDKHEIGEKIVSALNAFVQDGIEHIHKPAETVASSTATLAASIFHLPSEIREKLGYVHKKSLDRIERKHKKMVAKLMVKYSEPKDAA